MSRLVLVLMFSLVSFDAWAIVRYMVENMTCTDVQNTLQRDGAAILFRKSKSGVSLYDRYVKDGSMCSTAEIVAQESIPVADTDRCRVRKCVSRDRFGD